MRKSIRALFVVCFLLATLVIVPSILPTSAANDYEATLTVTTPSGTVTNNGSYLEMRNLANKALASPTVKTEVVLTLNKDVSLTSNAASISASSNSNAHFTLDFNGHDFALQSLTYASNFINLSKSGSITLKGMGENGEKSHVLSRSLAGFIYNAAASTDTVVKISDVDFTFTNMALGFADNAQYPHQPMFNLTAGDVTLDNVSVLFTGEEATAVVGSTGGSDISKLHPPFIQANGTANIKINNCEFLDTNTKGIMTYGIMINQLTTTVSVTNTKINAYNALYSNANTNTTFTGCELRATNTVFASSARPTVIDSVMYADNCPLSSGGAMPTLMYGSGKNFVYAGVTGVSGSYKVETGYQLCHVGNGKYTVSDGKGYSTVTLPAIYQSGMVFQRGEPITVHGTCDTDGNTVEVSFAGITKTATVSGGEWSVSFDAMPATTDLTLIVKELEPEYTEARVFENVAVGDVFILSGQSNMDYQAKYLEDYEEFRANANNYANLRGFLVPNAYRHGEDKIGSGEWKKLTADNIGEFSAIGYVMATKIAAELGDGVTVAIVDATYPGSIAKTWIDIETYKEHFGENCADVATYNAYLSFYKQYGRCPTSASEIAAWVGKSYQQIVASCYDSMIAFMQGYSAKAVVWYQGEGDLGRVSSYPAYYAALTDSFRKTFNKSDLPFAVIQLAPYSNGSTSNFRAMQQTLASIDPYTYLVATSGEGAVYNSPEFVNNSDLSLIFVHTSRKSPIGFNTADVILDKVYENENANKTLEIVSKKVVDGKVIITFNQNVTTGGVSEVLGFELQGYGGYKAAEATIDGNTVILTADGITDPMAVRYGFGSFYIEYQDGSIVTPVSGYSGGSMDSTSVTFKDINGNTYTITKDACEVIRSCIPGNVTSETGAPLYVFEFNL